MESFEDKIKEIDELLEKSRSQWRLTSIQWFDYDDISQKIRLHLYDKWDKWDQDKPFQPWCRRVISNQIKNQVRNHYGSFAKPCLKCPHYISEDECGLTTSGKQDDSCPLYEKWSKNKKHKYNVKLPLPIEDKKLNDQIDLYNEFDFELSIENLHDQVLKELKSEKHREIYTLLYIENQEKSYVAQKMGFKEESGRKEKRYKWLETLEALFQDMAKKVIEENDIIQGTEGTNS